jgi:EARP and GARP complex-interacting protein 1
VRLRHLYTHSDQVLDLAPSPVDAALLFTCGKAKGEPVEATLWRMDGLDGTSNPSDDGDVPSEPLSSVASLPTQATPPSRVVWKPDGSDATATVASVHGKSVFLWDLQTASLQQQDRLDVATQDVSAVQWDPHHAHQLSFASGAQIQTWDTRAHATAFLIEDAHLPRVLDIDYNPNKPYTLASGGEDGLLKFWDLRAANKPLLALAAHTHWLHRVRYNRFHDQLVLSTSSDATLALWRVSSISSAPIVELDEQDLMNEAAALGNDVVDTRIKSYEDHEDSVYSTAWSAADSWLFASVSYDGRMVVNTVPSTEKYKILL